LASADALKSTSSGSGTSSLSQSSVANLSLMGGLVAANVVKSNSSATCNGGQASVTGSAEIVGLVAAGQSILVSNPNLAISLPGGISLIVNEQTRSSGGNSGSTPSMHCTSRDQALTSLSRLPSPVSRASNLLRLSTFGGGRLQSAPCFLDVCAFVGTGGHGPAP